MVEGVSRLLHPRELADPFVFRADASAHYLAGLQKVG